MSLLFFLFSVVYFPQNESIYIVDLNEMSDSCSNDRYINATILLYIIYKHIMAIITKKIDECYVMVSSLLLRGEKAKINKCINSYKI